MADDDGGVLATLLKYLVLPLIVVGIAWYAIQNLLFGGNGGKARQDALDTITTIWAEYDKEYKDFSAKGSITPEEEEILKAKLELLKIPIQKVADSIPNTNEIAITLGGLIIAAVTLYELIKHLGPIGKQLRQFWDNLKAPEKPGAILSETGLPNIEYTYATADELSMIFRCSAIMDIADSGNVALASNLLTAEQTLYFTNLLPQMQTSYNVLMAQLPLLQGMQLAMAYYMLAELSVFIQFYPTTPPPFYGLPPPLPF